MKPKFFYILLALAEEDRHGADICREVLRLSEGRLHLWPARLYGALESLVEKGWTEDLTRSDRHPEGKSERRRYYRISPEGRSVLEAEAKRLSGLVKLARVRNKHSS